MIDWNNRQIDARTRHRLLFGLTGVFLWPGLVGAFAIAVLSGIAGGSTERQARGFIASHGRMHRIDDTLWDLLRVFENLTPIFAVLLAIACCVFIYECKRGTIRQSNTVLRTWAVVHLWLCVGLSAFILLAPLAWILFKR